MISRRKRKSLRRVKWIFIAAVVLGIGWVCGLLIFAQTLPDRVASPDAKTDAIVVLTGGSLRLESGLELLAEKRAQKLFVSGVHRGVDVRQLLHMSRHAPEAMECCIALGYDADNTQGNALETAVWLKNEKYNSIRLVTSSYHMPRSLVEFHAAMPGVKIVAHPVFPKSFKAKEWWFWPGSTGLIVEEYNKFLIAYLRRMIFSPDLIST
ncbi:MAG TPA: YdcF family protein [Rhodospirillaceae bacterium]|nr:hypothetical protein [Rhodospirillaceae bacterium]MBL25326.1 hypothetical protein [Rhodospirillaceae bacterium]HAA91086.1 YdcF family protein [Rhodospirillaceae bacterium]HAT34971.1 YdcF family protein [Rhodospirillaceae bacterium]